ncbi:SDR family oxidoreductase [Lachnospiraceae bacterium 38-10]
MLTLKNRTCVFAGASGQIGRGAVKALAEQGMNVVMITHNPAKAGEIVNEMKDFPGQVIAMSNEDSNEELFSRIYSVFGSADVMVSSTGGLLSVVRPEDISDALLNEKLSHQVTEPYNMVRAALPYLDKSTAPRIIFVANGGVLDGYAGENIADSIAGGGVVSMTYALARALAHRGITVNCIARSGMVNDHSPEFATDFDVVGIARDIPLGHIGTRDEFGALVQYIASEEAGFVTGHVFNLTGGLHIG